MNIFSNNRETISIFPVYDVTNEQNWRLDKYQQYQPIGIVSLLSHSNASFLPFSFKMGPTLKRDDYVGGKHDVLVTPPVSAELVVVVEPVYLLPGHQVGQDELGLYGHHGHRLEGEEDALTGHRVPGLGPHHAHQTLDADAEAAVLIVAGLVRQDHALLQPGVVGVHPPRDAARALDILCFSFATKGKKVYLSLII